MLVAFIAIAVFGFLAMDHNKGYTHGGCIAATSVATTCASAQHDHSFFHISIFKSFSLAMLGGAVIVAALLKFLFILNQTIRRTLENSPSSLYLHSIVVSYRYRMRVLSGTLRYRAQAYFLKWRSLHRGDVEYALARAHEYSYRSV